MKFYEFFMKPHRLLTTVILIIAATPILLSAQIIIIGAPTGQASGVIGSIAGSIQGEFQYWTTVSGQPAEYRRYGEFQITKPNWEDPAISRGHLDPPWDDGDWRIWVRPLPGFEDLLVNSKGRSNSGWDNLMELEIFTLAFPLSDHFQEGDYIRAYGWHVEDWGHSAVNQDHWANDTNGGKTELHPIIYLQKGDFEWSSFTLFTAQDGSGRFPLATQNLESYFPGWEIPLHPSYRPANVLPHPQTGSIANRYPVPLLKESAIVDVGIGSLGSSSANPCWETYASKIIATQYPGTVYLQPRLNGYAGCIAPLYFGDFRRTEESLFHDTVTANLVSLPDGHKAITGHITATLDNSGMYPSFVETIWEWSRPSEGSSNWAPILNPPGNTLSYDFKYSPSEDLWTNQWRLDVRTSTRPSNWSPGANRQTSGLRPAEDRVFAQMRIEYYIERSNITLNVTQKEVELWGCNTGYRVESQVRTAHKDVVAGSRGWEVALERTETGQVIPNPVRVQLQQGSPVMVGNVKVVRLNDNLVDLTFFDVPDRTSSGILPLVSGCPSSPMQLYNNAAKVRLYTIGTTDMGEWMSAESPSLGVESCRWVGGNRCESVARLWLEVEKLMLAVEKLKKLGLWTGELPQVLPPQLVKTWRPEEGGLGPVYEWYPEVPASVKPIVDTYKRLMEGLQVSPKEMTRFNAAISVVSGLPAVTRFSPPQKGFGKAIVPSFNATGKLSFPSKPRLIPYRPADLRRSQEHIVGKIDFGEDDFLTRGSITALITWAKQSSETLQGIVKLTYVGQRGVLSKQSVANRAVAIQRVLLGQGLKPERLRVVGVLRSDAGQAGYLEVRTR